MNAPQRFHRKPDVIEAMQWTGDNETAIWDWAGTSFVGGFNPRLYVRARESWFGINRGEWIIKDGKGFYPLDDQTFRQMFVEVNE